MKKIIFDFNVLNNDKKLNLYLNKKLQLSKLMNGRYGFNFDAFWDCYSYSDDNHTFVLKNINKIKNENFKTRIRDFIQLLEDLKKTNPNFNYVIDS